MTRRSRQLLAAFVSALAASTAALGVAEAALRRTPLPVDGWPPRADNDVVCMQPSLTRGYAPIPGTCGRDEAGAVTTVAPGLAPARILLLGDSVSTHAWVPRLAATLAAALAPRGLELHNAAVSGYDSCQEAATWAERSADPDLVVLQTCPNDGVVTPTVARLPGGQVRYFGDQGAVTFPASFLASRVLTALALRLAPRDPAPDRGPAGSFLCVAQLAESAAAAKVPLVVLQFPSFDGKPPGRAERSEAAGLAPLGLDLVDVRALLAARSEGLLVSPDGVHPDQPAQAVALADLIAPILAARLPPR